MFLKDKNHIFLCFMLVAFLSLSLFIFSTSRVTTAQLWGFPNTLTTNAFWRPFQTSWQIPFQNQWSTPYQNPWQTSWQTPWQNPFQSSWQTQYQNPWQSPYQTPWQTPYQTPWQTPYQNPWQTPYQNPWQTPWQNPFQNPFQNPWQQPQYETADLDLDSSDDGDSFIVNVGETISIILESNATTGFKWVLDSTVLDPNIVSNTSSKYFPGVSSLVGSVGTEQWIFEAEATGTTNIELNYKRIWEISVEDTFEVEITVE